MPDRYIEHDLRGFVPPRPIRRPPIRSVHTVSSRGVPRPWTEALRILFTDENAAARSARITATHSARNVSCLRNKLRDRRRKCEVKREVARFLATRASVWVFGGCWYRVYARSVVSEISEAC